VSEEAATIRRLRASLTGRVHAYRAVLWDLALSATLSAASFTPQLAGNGLQLGELAPRPGDALAVVLTVGQCAPLAVRRRLPALCLALAGCCFAVYQALGYHSNLAGVGLFAALYSAGAHAGRHRRALAGAATAGYLALALTLHGLRSPERPLDYCTFYVALLACWGAGAWVRGRQAAEAERRREEARLVVARERARIARELHDVVTHHVTAIVVQADAAQYLLGSAPDRAGDNLAAISGTGRRALTELRHLLGVLDGPRSEAGQGNAAADDDAAPGTEREPALGPLSDLVEQTRLAGQPVELFEDGDPASIAAGPDLVAYRVVQEALTNAVKHAPGRRTVVRVRHGEDMHIEVANEGPAGAAGGVSAGTVAAGRGLVGLRERVGMCGGELTAGARPGGGFLVSARIPSGGAR
jgi:signal transduction histidine kinase